jgi:eukaryotic-like serine/threonine-protein kinase
MFPRIFGKYVLEGEIASGGMAVVYLATLRGVGGFEKRLVVKQIRAELAGDPDFVRRFVEEAKTTVELSHPNIVPVYELGVEQGVYYIAMELTEGVTLAELLDAGGPLSPEAGAYLGAEVCRALDYAHRRAGIVHRDVTPRNVVVDEEGHVRLIDFGIAAPSSQSPPGRRIFGSPGHMPPEQMRGEPAAPTADVFAVGALLLEAWTGQAPFRRSTPEASARALTEPVRDPRQQVPALESLGEVATRCVALDTGARPQSAEELGRALRGFLRDVDATEVARALGERVRAVRAQSTASAPRGDASLETPRTPVTAAMDDAPARVRPPGVTRTFASKPQLSAWTGAPGGGGTGVAGSGPAPVGRRARRALALGALVVGGALLAVALQLPGMFRAPPADASLPVASPAPAAPPPPASEPLPGVAGGASGSTGPEPTHRERPPAPRPAPTAAPLPGGSATLVLTSDVPARVMLGGQTLGTTPLRGVRRPPGRYRVTFASADLEERVATVVEVGSGQTLGVHAEFTHATPAIRLR